MIYPTFLLVVLVTVSTIYFSAPHIAFAAGRFLGWHLKRRTQPRRELILERVVAERKRAVEQQRKSQTSLDDEWEKIDKARTLESSQARLDDKTRDWAGVVGFFHPFWYNAQSCSTMRARLMLTRALAMLAVVANVYCGMRSTIPNYDGPMPLASSTPATMTLRRSRCSNVSP